MIVTLDGKRNIFNKLPLSNGQLKIHSLDSSETLTTNAFFYINDVLVCSKNTPLLYKSHYLLYDLMYEYLPKDYILKHGLIKYSNIRLFVSAYGKEMQCPGRIFLKLKIITFWLYPDNMQLLHQVINDLNLNYDTNIDNSWYICVSILKLDILTVNRLYLKNKDVWYQCSDLVNPLILVPIKDYEKVYGFSYNETETNNQLINHILSPLQKKWVKVFQKLIKLPDGMTQALYKDKTTRYQFTLNKIHKQRKIKL